MVSDSASTYSHLTMSKKSMLVNCWGENCTLLCVVHTSKVVSSFLELLVLFPLHEIQWMMCLKSEVTDGQCKCGFALPAGGAAWSLSWWCGVLEQPFQVQTPCYWTLPSSRGTCWGLLRNSAFPSMVFSSFYTFWKSLVSCPKNRHSRGGEERRVLFGSLALIKNRWLITANQVKEAWKNTMVLG